MLLSAVFSPHCSSPSTPTTAYLKTPLSSSWSLQMTPHWLASCSAYKQEAKELAVWCSLNNLELNTLKTVEMIVNFRRSSSPLPGEEVQTATGAAETVLLCHHWICPLHFNTCLVQLSNQIWPQKTNEGSPDCWTNHWYNPPSLTKNCTYPDWSKVLAKSLWTLTSSKLLSWIAAIWSMLQSSDHQNGQAQEQFLPPSNPSHEHLNT